MSVVLVGCGRTAAPSTSVPRSQETRSRDTAAQRSDASPGGADAGPDADVDVDELFAELESEPSERIREVPACLDLQGSDDCTGVGAVMLACVGLGNIFHEQVTPRMTDCLQAHQASAVLCETEVVKDCALEAIGTTPVEKSVAAICDALFARCPEPEDFKELYTLDTCRHGLSSLRKTPREDFVRCMQDRCELRLCVGHLL